jgi:hypothetical protein
MPRKTQLELREAGGVLFDPGVFWTRQARQKVIKDFNSIKGRWGKIRTLDGLQHIGEDRAGVSLWPLVEFQFHWLFNHGFYEILKRIYLAQKTVEHLKPDLLLTPDESSVNAVCWSLAAGSSGVPSLTQLHGGVFLNPLTKPWKMVYTDKVAVWGPLTQEWYVKATEESKEDFPCTGYPVFETYREPYKRIDPDKVYDRLGLDRKKPVVLLFLQMAVNASESYYDSPVRIYDALLKEMEKMPEVQVVMRLHPASRPRIASASAKRFKTRCLVNPEIDLLSLLKVSDIVFSQCTTPFIEAMVVGKPVFFFNVRASKDLAWAAEKGGIPIIGEPSEILPAVRSVLHDTKKRDEILEVQRRFLEQYTGPIDGRASGRTMDLLKRMVRERSGLVRGETSMINAETVRKPLANP